MLGPRPDLSTLSTIHWDVVVVGGGITGAGIALEASRLGKKVLLLEQEDFAWGTSSRSSKMVHGGLRYIAQGHVRLTRDSLRERERLLRELPEMVHRQPYAFLVYQGKFPGRWAMQLVLGLYDFLAGIRDHVWIDAKNLHARIPSLSMAGVRGAMIYTDALTDDARLVLRILHEAVAFGACVANYMQVEGVRQQGEGFSLDVRDCDGVAHATLSCRTLINATGAWADRLSGSAPKVRPLRGSHLLLQRQRLPVDDCVTVLHPRDHRPVFIYPWLGLTCVGTTDLDHGEDLSREPHCTQQELDYLFEVLNHQFADLGLTPQDVVSTFAGVRPVVSSGRGLKPSQESREHSVWKHGGVVSVAGGKLTTFRLIALDALMAAGIIDAAQRGQLQTSAAPIFKHSVAMPAGLGHPTAALPTGSAMLAALAWVLEREMVVHLDDVLLRRLRLGNVLAQGAQQVLVQIRPLCLEKLGWSDARWGEEVERYRKIIDQYYGLPNIGATA